MVPLNLEDSLTVFLKTEYHTDIISLRKCDYTVVNEISQDEVFGGLSDTCG